MVASYYIIGLYRNYIESLIGEERSNIKEEYSEMSFRLGDSSLAKVVKNVGTLLEKK